MSILLCLQLSLLPVGLTIKQLQRCSVCPRQMCACMHIPSLFRIPLYILAGFCVRVTRVAIFLLVAPDVFWSDCTRTGLTTLPEAEC